MAGLRRACNHAAVRWRKGCEPGRWPRVPRGRTFERFCSVVDPQVLGVRDLSSPCLDCRLRFFGSGLCPSSALLVDCLRLSSSRRRRRLRIGVQLVGISLGLGNPGMALVVGSGLAHIRLYIEIPCFHHGIEYSSRNIRSIGNMSSSTRRRSIDTLRSTIQWRER
jgi:hypothetical protein